MSALRSEADIKLNLPKRSANDPKATFGFPAHHLSPGSGHRLSAMSNVGVRLDVAAHAGIAQLVDACAGKRSATTLPPTVDALFGYIGARSAGPQPLSRELSSSTGIEVLILLSFSRSVFRLFCRQA